MGEPGVGEGCVGEEEVLATEETDERVDAETMVGCADAELTIELGLPALMLAAALSTAAHKLSAEFSSRPLAITSTRRPQSAELTRKTSGINPASAVKTAASSAVVKPSNSTPPRPAYVRRVKPSELPISDIS